MDKKIILVVGLFMLSGIGSASILPDISPNSILAFTYQHASNAKRSYNAQLDILGYLPVGTGQLQFELKAGSTPRANGVTAMIPEANALAGETQAPNGDGRLAMTQLYYQNQYGQGTYNLGLLFPANYIDTNPVADNEYPQFIGTTFVNDPTIDMPIYALGGSYTYLINQQLSVLALLTSTQDLYGHNYLDLWGSHTQDSGAFGAIELDWQAENLQGNIGIWLNGNHRNISLTNGKRQNSHGIYGNIGGTLAVEYVQWNIRLGWADPQVSQSSNFISIEANKALHISVWGKSRKLLAAMALSRTGPSSDIQSSSSPVIQFETYIRMRLVDSVYISPDIQWVTHSQFNPNRKGIWIEGIRMSIAF